MFKKKEYDKKYREDHKEEINKKHRQIYIENKEEICKKNRHRYKEDKDKVKKRNKEYYRKNKDKINKKHKIYWEEHKDSLHKKQKIYREEHKEEMKQYYEKNKKHHKDQRLKKKYGVDVNYDKLLLEQNNKCLICGIHIDDYRKPFCIDHDHKTGKIRGALCHVCNLGLGIYENKKELFEEYLNKHV